MRVGREEASGPLTCLVRTGTGGPASATRATLALGGRMPIAASDAATALTAAFSDRGPRNPKIAFRADGEQVLVTVTATDGGEVTHVFEQPMPCPPPATTPGRLRSFAHGTAMAAQQLATRGAPDA